MLKVHALLGARILRITIPVFGCASFVLSGREGATAPEGASLTVLDGVPEQIAFSHALIQLMQQQLSGVGCVETSERIPPSVH